jgi:hypothetical protein
MAQVAGGQADEGHLKLVALWTLTWKVLASEQVPSFKLFGK